MAVVVGDEHDRGVLGGQAAGADAVERAGDGGVAVEGQEVGAHQRARDRGLLSGEHRDPAALAVWQRVHQGAATLLGQFGERVSGVVAVGGGQQRDGRAIVACREPLAEVFCARGHACPPAASAGSRLRVISAVSAAYS